MKTPAPSQRRRGRLKGLASLDSIRPRLAPAAADATSATKTAGAAPAQPVRSERPSPIEREDGGVFIEAMRGVTPLRRGSSKPASAAPPPPEALQRERDDRAALDESLTTEIGIESLLDTDDALSFRRDGISGETLRKLRRGFWVVQAELDLHGHRVDEARHALGEFLKRSIHRGVRCIRIVHGKGLGSRDGIPILKGKVKTWLTRHEEVIAFCQAPPTNGGAGALIVLLKPSTPAG
jgi:DNA-nicking Smr family endonuclease